MTLKQRHGCLTTYLIFMIVVGCLGVLLNFYIGITFDAWKNTFAQQNISNVSRATLILSGLLGILHIACSVALLKWKKWGFYGILGISIASFIINISSGLGLGNSLPGLAGIAILYGVLNIGGENRAWHQLE